MKKSKVFVSLLLAVMLAVSGTVIAGAENDTNYSGTTISGTISFDGNQNIDVTDLDIKVYSLVLSGTYEDSKQYDHVYETTVHPDNYGNFSAERPSEYTYFEIDENTIPEGYGVDKIVDLIPENESEFSACLSKISDFKVDFISETVDFYDSDKNPLTVNPNYELAINREKLKTAFLSNEPIDVDCEYHNTTIKSVQQTSDLAMIDKIDYLYNNNIINEGERIAAYAENLGNEEISEEMDVIFANYIVNSYAYNNNRELTFEEEYSTFVASYAPTYTQPATYYSMQYTSENDPYFMLHYEAGAYSADTLDSVYEQLESVKDFLCDNTIPTEQCTDNTAPTEQHYFEVPATPAQDPYYHVYIVQNDTYTKSAVTWGNYFGSVDQSYSFIIVYLNSDNINSDGSISNTRKGNLCHEFMHSIQFHYNFFNVNQSCFSEVKNFSEAIANTVKLRMIHNCGLASAVYKFLQTPHLSLFYNLTEGDFKNRRYGALLYPLSIEQDYNDFTTIKDIYVANQNYHEIYTDIENVLRASSNNAHGFIDSYLNCMLYDYSICDYYDYYEESWDNSPKKITVSEIPSGASALAPLGSNYYEITDPQYNYFVFTMYNHNPTSYPFVLQKVDTMSDGSLTNQTYYTSGYETTLFLDLNNVSKTCIILSNTWLDAHTGYYVEVL